MSKFFPSENVHLQKLFPWYYYFATSNLFWAKNKVFLFKYIVRPQPVLSKLSIMLLCLHLWCLINRELSQGSFLVMLTACCTLVMLLLVNGQACCFPALEVDPTSYALICILLVAVGLFVSRDLARISKLPVFLNSSARLKLSKMAKMA